jgi:enoyl-CoA hydratase/carnithine racemase
LRQLRAAVRDVAADDEIRVLAVTGTGRAFSVGGDIKAMDGMDAAAFLEMEDLYQCLAAELRALGKPVLAAVNGYALGGGLEVALMCDLRIAAATARFGLPDAELGFSPTGGLTYLLPRVVGLGRALHLALAAEPIDAAEAERLGLVTQVVADDDLIATVETLAARMASWPKTGLAHIKRAFHTASESNFADALRMEVDLDVACFADPETRAALAAFLESRKK